jgi:L-threonylcarbamoyladenylate synthase
MGVYGSDRRQGEGQLRHHGQEEVEAAAEALRAGGLVLLPTETVYGLGADASNPTAVAAIFEAKGRPRFNPLIAHVHDLETAARIAAFDDRAQALAARSGPGR